MESWGHFLSKNNRNNKGGIDGNRPLLFQRGHKWFVAISLDIGNEDYLPCYVVMKYPPAQGSSYDVSVTS